MANETSPVSVRYVQLCLQWEAMRCAGWGITICYGERITSVNRAMSLCK